MNLFEQYMIDLNTYPRFKRKNKWADKFLVRIAGAFFLLMLLKFLVEFILESIK